MKITIILLILLIGILFGVIYIQNKKIEISDKIHYMDSLTNERKDKLIQKQDSLIEMLQSYKITKVMIVEKDTVK